jgi:ABC-type transporter Mla MlaB component
LGPPKTPASPWNVCPCPYDRSLRLVVETRIAPIEIPALCDCVRGLLLWNEKRAISCDLSALVDPDADTIGALARLHLTARGVNGQVRLTRASKELLDLVALIGLTDVLTLEVSPRR